MNELFTISAIHVWMGWHVWHLLYRLISGIITGFHHLINILATLLHPFTQINLDCIGLSLVVIPQLFNLLSPQKSVDWPITAAEIRIFCLQSKMYSVAEYLRKRIQRGDSSFFSEYLNTEDHCEWKHISLQDFFCMINKQIGSWKHD